jgi:hypothetical protein
MNGILKNLVSSTRLPLSLLTRNLRSKPAVGYRDEKVIFNEDGSMVVCWHPEPKFPYEYTRPLPTQPVETDSKLKVQAVEDMKELYHHKPERLQRRDLMRLTWTTKQMWFSNTYWRKQRKDPKERPYL